MNTELEKINIWSVFNTGKIEEYSRRWEINFIEKDELIIAGDFNIRIGNEKKKQGWSKEVEARQRKRASKDKVIGNGRKSMIEMVNKNRKR